ncbi:hypothetical protein BB559_003209 [Furculomyces boomerangus]|uniref:Uncharacterized protein n=1 Tax=Furculomyces boomerangus TaxID=61424 RepID=A0A2T9YMT9_9FUNG|nr:hypothetical protein BB559_003209 [Furculomyces boomerangus]
MIDNKIWKDSTDLLIKATSSLKPGEMIKVETFRLTDCMSALEIMDTKMDSGLFSQESVGNIDDPLSLHQALWIIDELFNLEIMYYRGDNIAQTLYSSIYYSVEYEQSAKIIDNIRSLLKLNDFNPKNFITNSIIFPYIITTAKCVELTLDELRRFNIYEDEDFSMKLFGKNYWGQISPEESLSLLQDSITYLEKNHNLIKSTLVPYSEQANMVPEVLDQTEEHQNINFDIIEQIILRLKLKKHFLSSLICLQFKKIKRDPEFVTLSQTELNSTESYLETIMKSYTHNPTDPTNSKIDAFDNSFIRKLSCDMPIRRLAIHTPAECLDLFKTLIHELYLIKPFLNLKSIDELMEFSVAFSQRKVLAFPYTRSLLQSLICSDNVFLLKYHILDFVRSSVSNNVGHIAFTLIRTYYNEYSQKDNEHTDTKKLTELTNLEKKIDEFVSLYTVPLLNAIKSYYQNRQRQRRVQARMLVDIEYMQTKAEELDEDIHKFLGPNSKLPSQFVSSENGIPNIYLFSNSVYITKLQIIESMLKMGFSLNVYQQYEFPLVFWYLGSIFEVHYRCLERIGLINRAVKFRFGSDILDQFLTSFAQNPNSSYLSNASHLQDSLYFMDDSIKNSINKDLSLFEREEFKALNDIENLISPRMSFVEAQKQISFGFYIFTEILSCIKIIPIPWNRFLDKNTEKLVETIRNLNTKSTSKGSKKKSKSGNKNTSLHKNEKDDKDMEFLINAAENIVNCKYQESGARGNARFHLRFRCLQRLGSPIPNTYEEFASSFREIFTGLSIKKLLLHSQNSFRNASKILENLAGTKTSASNQHSEYFVDQINSMRKLCIANILSITKFLNNGNVLLPGNSIVLDSTVINIYESFDNLHNVTLSLLKTKLAKQLEIIVKDSKKEQNKGDSRDLMDYLAELSLSETPKNTKKAIKNDNINNDISKSDNELILKTLHLFSLTNWECEFSYKYHKLWPCINLTSIQKKDKI